MPKTPRATNYLQSRLGRENYDLFVRYLAAKVSATRISDDLKDAQGARVFRSRNAVIGAYYRNKGDLCARAKRLGLVIEEVQPRKSGGKIKRKVSRNAIPPSHPRPTENPSGISEELRPQIPVRP